MHSYNYILIAAMDEKGNNYTIYIYIISSLS